MLQTYCFPDGDLEFDDTRTVRELLEHAFDAFDYWEPLGMEHVTVFQAHHPDTFTGWFTTDTSRTCAEEIRCPDTLCFAYHVPDFFYYAEGGWGHHMASLGNHPVLEEPVMLHFIAPDFRHTLVINGTRSFMDVVRCLQNTDYFPEDATCVRIQEMTLNNPFERTIRFADPILHGPLTDLIARLPRAARHFIIR